ncbi:outer membrane beta-barrel family protein [Foetidibacter luteolus]|uniref:outer membrane beta-barrel family protein n=1 Tax=Foetidibacter luteolus TaxID=2608880 RepID=UPI00129B646F|nr:outer membrane beta-barrel family protein [Foetidibacter luteolus]
MMRSSTLLLFIFSLCANTGFAQSNTTGTVKGALKDTASGQLLKEATITILNQTDSSVVLYRLAGPDGNFSIDNVPLGNYLLMVSFQGYDNFYRPFALSAEKNVFDAGNVYMHTTANDLGNVTVQAPPIIIKKDTVEFNAGMFKTKPNAVAEDLLKKLPGVEVDKDGNVKAQGEQVSRILVDGKRFFGDDPKMATKNLPPDVIDKIQVFDDLSDQSKFTGFDDGNRVKTINITTKKNMRKGYFGRVVAGAGDKGLYDEAVNLSRFNGDQQITIIGQANNTNKQNFTRQDIFGSGGGGNRGGGGMRGSGAGALLQNNSSNGITNTLAGGINYRDVWGKNTDAYGSYFYNNVKLNTEQVSTIENLYPGDSSLFNDRTQKGENRNINHRLNLNIETKFDTLNSMIIRPNISWQQSDNNSASVTSATRGKSVPVSNSDARTSSHNSGYNGSADILFRHRFAQKKGRTVSLELNFAGSDKDGNGTNYSTNQYFNPLGDSTSIINQQYLSQSNSKSFGSTFSYTEPISKNSMLELNYNYSRNKNTSAKTTYSYNPLDDKFSIIDTLLTNSFDNTYTSNRVTLNYRLQAEKLNFSIGSGVQFGNLTSENRSKEIFLTQKFTNLYPTANLTYRFNRTTNLRFNYSGRTAQPNVQQLQPVIDNSDPLNISVGNPNLKQSFTNSFRLLYTSFDNVKFRNIFASINASFINNNIVNSTTTILSTGVDTIKPVNLNGNYNISGYFNYGFQLKNPKSNLNFGTNFSHSRGVALVSTLDSANAQQIKTQNNVTTNYSIGETIRWTTNLKENFDMNFSASPTYNISRYSVQPGQNANYFTLGLSAEPTYYTKNGWILSSDFTYTYYGSGSSAYSATSIPLWNASIGKQLFKNKQGEIKLSVFDLLNQNVSLNRTVTDNYIQQTQTKVLTRYVLLTFTYNLRNFGAKQQQRQRSDMPPGMRFRGDGPIGMPPGGGFPPPGGPGI